MPETSIDPITDALPDQIDLVEAREHTAQLAEKVFLTPAISVQLLVIVASFIVSFFTARFLKPRIEKTIADSHIWVAFKTLGYQLCKVLFPVIFLALLYIGTLSLTIMEFDFQLPIMASFMKMLLAWIVIQLAVQFISNSFVRSVVGFVILTIAVLSIAGVLDETNAALSAIGLTIGDFRITALAVIKGLISIFALLYFAMAASRLAEKKIYTIKSLNRSSQVLLIKIIRAALIVIATIIAITSSGIDLSLFAVFGGAIGLGIGFGLQKGISNLFSGMLLLMDQSIKPGDVIELEDSGTFGWVSRMAARYTEIVTRDNKSYLIPNEDFITQRVVNWSYGNNLIRIAVDFGVHYDSDPHKVIAVAKEAAKKPARVVETPEPVCWITEFGDSSINFSLRFWIKDAEGGVTNVKGEVYLALWDAFKENGIQIPYPHREVFVHEVKK